jgi:hypothetical protein
MTTPFGNGAVLGLTEVELAQAEALCAQATPGPWVWAEETFNRRASGDRPEWAYLLLGPAAACMAGVPAGDLDAADFDQVMGLPWSSVEGNVLVNAVPTPEDQLFIAAARELLPRALAEVRRLRKRVAELADRDGQAAAAP